MTPRSTRIALGRPRRGDLGSRPLGRPKINHPWVEQPMGRPRLAHGLDPGVVIHRYDSTRGRPRRNPPRARPIFFFLKGGGGLKGSIASNGRLPVLRRSQLPSNAASAARCLLPVACSLIDKSTAASAARCCRCFCSRGRRLTGPAQQPGCMDARPIAELRMPNIAVTPALCSAFRFCLPVVRRARHRDPGFSGAARRCELWPRIPRCRKAS